MPQKAQRPGKFVKMHANRSLTVFATLLVYSKGQAGGTVTLEICQAMCRTSYTYLPDQIVSSFLGFV